MAKAVKKSSRKAVKKVIKKVAKKAAAKKAVKKVAKKAAVKKAVKKIVKKVAKKIKRKPNAAFMAPLNISDALAKVVGSKSLPRTEVVKKIWVYIKKNSLQDKTNRRMINADANLKPIFIKEQISMFEMAGLLNKHLK